MRFGFGLLLTPDRAPREGDLQMAAQILGSD